MNPVYNHLRIWLYNLELYIYNRFFLEKLFDLFMIKKKLKQIKKIDFFYIIYYNGSNVWISFSAASFTSVSFILPLFAILSAITRTFGISSGAIFCAIFV